MRAVVALVLLAAACGTSETKPTNPEVQGVLSLDGKPLAVTTCRPGRGVTTYVELVTSAGKLRFEDKQLFWSQKDFGRGDKLACERLERSWGGGMRTDGTAYFRGHLIFTCRGAVGALTGDVTVDCGHITPEERAQLDKNRTDMLAEQAATKAVGCEPVAEREAALFANQKPVALAACRDDAWPVAVQDCAIAAADAAAFDACLTPALRDSLQHRR